MIMILVSLFRSWSYHYSKKELFLWVLRNTKGNEYDELVVQLANVKKIISICNSYLIKKSSIDNTLLDKYIEYILSFHKLSVEDIELIKSDIEYFILALFDVENEIYNKLVIL